ncbi:GMC family oxidoreductase N-terminal domain-containing protein [Dinghuibacter silviterrae]|uniref:Cholesterol oxidase n=1 Tax=Dinghuibacter silviterrae TaxID=1539049 RepID=A0A4R8DGH8_9BACT|nr:GMC family oxidoreductase [Dinghuibacter silviterrae]TDW96753.1 cholesterol oxidase [Dinghuibacter silviterrae]
MKQLALPLSDIKPFYDVLIIGSGYGGSIAASRLSRAGFRVGLLEKGKEFQPGQYPSDLAAAGEEMQVHAPDKPAETNGLYEFHFGADISVFKGCGLGGTSLVNANVSIKPEERVFENPRWPKAIRDDMDSLNLGYERARSMLSPSPYPEGAEGYPELAKARAMKTSAGALGFPFRYPDINVTFADHVNTAGVPQSACTNCGDCVTGCNHGAKNTLLMNYLPDAYNHGAEIFCGVAVSHIVPPAAGTADAWTVYYDVFNTGRDLFHAPPLFTRARVVIVSAGTLGSTEILLRSREKGLQLSDTLGTHFTGNGDVLGFSYNCKEPINGIGLGNHEGEPVGPCITSLVDMRHREVLTDGMTFEEGSIPAPIASVVNTAMLGLAGLDPRHDWFREKKQEAISLLEGPYKGATNRMQTYLVMTHDDGNGTMTLRDNRLAISWPGVGQQPIFQKVNDALKTSTEALQGEFIRDVVWNKFFHYELVTVHPLGGCCMGEDAETGVTDHSGGVFKTEKDTWPGLYVLDGSVVPVPLGTNPLFTISALAERAAPMIAARYGRSIDYTDHPPQTPPGVEYPVAVQFTETMKGFVSTGEKTDFQAGYDKGKADGSACLFTLTVRTGDISKMAADPAHPGTMSGTLTAPALSDQPMTISGGVFNLFEADPDPAHLKMKYQMQLHTHEGRTFFFYGYKEVDDDQGLRLWKDTTVLYSTIYDGTDAGAPVLAKGILKIAPVDFALQMTTMEVVHASSLGEKARAMTAFSRFFAGKLADIYFKKWL